MATFVTIINILGPVLILLLKVWQDGQAGRDQEARNAEIQQGRTDIANGNATAVGERIDSVLTVQAGTPAGDPPKLGTDQDTAGRLAEITGS